MEATLPAGVADCTHHAGAFELFRVEEASDESRWNVALCFRLFQKVPSRSTAMSRCISAAGGNKKKGKTLFAR